MGITYYLLSPQSRVALPLGKRDESQDGLYDGPVVWIGSERRYLPPDRLAIVQTLFRQKHSDALVVADYELYPTGGIAEDSDEELVILEGDRDWDLPLTSYFPEMLTDEFWKEILINGRPIT